MAASASPPTYDIAIIGAGPFGLTLSTILARWGYTIKHVDDRPHPTVTGRADGIQPRSLDLLRNLGLKRALMARQPAKIFEVAFWDPAPVSERPGGRDIVRTGSWASCPKFIDARYVFTTLLHQGHIERIFLDDMKLNGVQVQRPWRISDFENEGRGTHPVRVEFTSVNDPSQKETIRTKYLLDGEGARSFVREKLGIKMVYKDPIAHVWGVMDGVVRTDFPDIKLKCTIHSDAGSLMVIPREDNMVRLYIQIASSTDADFDPRKTATEAEVQAAAKKILRPYTIEWESVVWYSVYPIGQGISERYTLDGRIFLGGDACHTHSPKAGQGMNTAFLDASNLAWKIHHVETGFASPSILATYESERKHIAEELLAFDAKWAALFSSRPPSASEVSAAGAGSPGKSLDASGSGEGETETEFVKTFKANCEFTSGYGVLYEDNLLNWSSSAATSRRSQLFLSPSSPSPDGLFSTPKPGKVLPPATVTRIIDANVVHLEQQVPMNGAFRIFIFAGWASPSSFKPNYAALHTLSQHLSHRSSFLFCHPNRTAASHHNQTTPHSPLFTLLTLLPSPRAAISIETEVPALLARYRKHIYADDVWDQRVPNVKSSAHAKMGIYHAQADGAGAVVVVRPDGYVGCVVKLVEGKGTADALNEYFSSFSAQQIGTDSARFTEKEARL